MNSRDEGMTLLAFPRISTLIPGFNVLSFLFGEWGAALRRASQRLKE